MEKPLIVIDLSERIFLESFDEFVAVLLPDINQRRKIQGLPPMTDDEQTNEFLFLRKKYGITEER